MSTETPETETKADDRPAYVKIAEAARAESEGVKGPAGRHYALAFTAAEKAGLLAEAGHKALVPTAELEAQLWLDKARETFVQMAPNA